MSFKTLVDTMGTISSVVSDKLLKEDYKNVIVWVKDGIVRFGAFSGIVSTATTLDAEVNVKEGEFTAQLKAKDINDIISTFSSLQRTEVSQVDIEIKDNEAFMILHERGLDIEGIANPEAYNQISRFRITKPPVREVELQSVKDVYGNMDLEVQETAQLFVYILPLLPTVAKETREANYNIMFDNELVYTIPSQYAAVMPNRLPDVFKGFRLSNSMVTFLKNFIGGSETYEFGKVLGNGGLVVLTVKVGDSIATIKCPDMSRAFDMTNFVTVPENGVIVDKAYLKDVLKRIALGNEAARIDIEIANGTAEMRVSTKTMSQSIPVMNSKGEGSFAFEARADLISAMIFAHTDLFESPVYLYMTTGARNNIELAVSDETKAWHTKILGLAQARTQAW